MTGEIATDQSTSLAKLGTEINDIHEQAMLHASEALKHALHCGNLLIKAKATVLHGHWLPWLRQSVTFGERTAQGYMRLAQRYSRLQMRGSVADLSVRGALKELATPYHHGMFDDFAAWTERSQALSAERPADHAAWSIDDAVACVNIIREFNKIAHRYGLCDGGDDCCLVCTGGSGRVRAIEPGENVGL